MYRTTVFRRRWRELVELSAALNKEYGRGTPLNLSLPRLHTSVRSSRAPRTLQHRPPVIERYLSSVVSKLSCVPSTAQGPPLLLQFLGVAPDGSLLNSTEEILQPIVQTYPTHFPSERAGGGSDEGGQLPLRQLLMQGKADAGSVELVALRSSVRQLSWMLRLCCLSIALAGGTLLAPLPEVAAVTAYTLLGISLVGSLALLLPGSSSGEVGVGAGLGGAHPNLLSRYVRVFALFWRVVAHYRLTRFRAARAQDEEAEAEVWTAAHEKAGATLKSSMLALGGLWVKFGQYMATRVDILPLPLSRPLASMLDSNPPRPLPLVLSTLIDTFGIERLCAHVASVDPSPMSVASIAQVHRATLTNGTEVVVKVQHGEVGGMIEQDLKQIKQLGKWLSWLEPQIDVCPLLDEMAELHAAVCPSLFGSGWEKGREEVFRERRARDTYLW